MPKVAANIQNKQHFVTSPSKVYRYHETLDQHPATLRQWFLDTNNMSLLAQTRLHNDALRTLKDWQDSLT